MVFETRTENGFSFKRGLKLSLFPHEWTPIRKKTVFKTDKPFEVGCKFIFRAAWGAADCFTAKTRFFLLFSFFRFAWECERENYLWINFKNRLCRNAAQFYLFILFFNCISLKRKNDTMKPWHSCGNYFWCSRSEL
jgi:hypothetical protein